MTSETASELRATFDQRVPIFLELGFRKEALGQLKAYLELLWESNTELNLISRKMTPVELIENHVIDCLLPLKKFPTGIQSAADFGAGGGLPGVVFALHSPDLDYHLYEKSILKREFLQRCQKLSPNLKIAPEVTADFGGVELVTARAFKPIDVILEMSKKYYAAGGKYFLLKGRREKIDEEVALARKKFKDLKVEIEALASPVLSVERHLVSVWRGSGAL